MKVKTVSFKSEDELKKHIRLKTPTFYCCSQTSTVIPYDKLEKTLASQGIKEFTIGNLSNMPCSMEMTEEGHLRLRGAVNWKEAKSFCEASGRSIQTSPTEELASVLSGIATSATGERSFGLGTLRDQLREVQYIDYQGEKRSLSAKKKINNGLVDKALLHSYQVEYQKYKSFKNGPFPRLERESDLMAGFEGQLGVIVEAVIETIPSENVQYIFIALSHWENDFSGHIEVYKKVQKLREFIYSCEFIDHNSQSYLPKEAQIREGRDLVFLEIKASAFEDVYKELLKELSFVSDEDIFEVPASKCRNFRMSIPRAIFEENSKKGIVKKGTDAQALGDSFLKLIELYRKWSKCGISYNLFGHFGDGHLHFNFMPMKGEEELVYEKLEELYEEVSEIGGSPFAEHGIGLIKQRFISSFYGETQREMFKLLKQKFDPDRIFFPEGYLKEVNE